MTKSTTKVYFYIFLGASCLLALTASSFQPYQRDKEFYSETSSDYFEREESKIAVEGHEAEEASDDSRESGPSSNVLSTNNNNNNDVNVYGVVTHAPLDPEAEMLPAHYTGVKPPGVDHMEMRVEPVDSQKGAYSYQTKKQIPIEVKEIPADGNVHFPGKVYREKQEGQL